MNRNRYALVLLTCAAVHALSMLLHSRHAFALDTPPSLTHSLLIAAIIVWSAEGRK